MDSTQALAITTDETIEVSNSNWDKVFDITSKALPVLDADVVFDPSVDAKAKFEALALHQAQLTCRSQEFRVAFTETVLEDLQLCKRRIHANSAVMDNVKKTVDTIQEELTDLKKGMSSKATEMDKALKEFKNSSVKSSKSIKYTEDEIGKVVWPILPLLVDGLKGIAGWVPVNHVLNNGTVVKLVVVSVPMVQFLVRTYDNNQTLVGKIDSFLKQNLRRYKYDTKIKMKEFISIMLKTPFKPYVHAANCAYVAKGNIDNYIIMEAAVFKSVLAEVHEYFPERPLELPENFPDAKINKNVMYQDWALTAQSPVDSNSDMIPVIRRSLTFEERSECVPMLTTWWKECYGSGMADFFDMETGSQRMGHVRSGKYVKDPLPNQSVRGFESVLRHCQKFVDPMVIDSEVPEVPEVPEIPEHPGGKSKRNEEPLSRKKSKKSRTGR